MKIAFDEEKGFRNATFSNEKCISTAVEGSIAMLGRNTRSVRTQKKRNVSMASEGNVVHIERADCCHCVERD